MDWQIRLGAQMILKLEKKKAEMVTNEKKQKKKTLTGKWKMINMNRLSGTEDS